MIRVAQLEDLEAINKLGIIFNSNFSNTYNIKDYLINDNYIILINEEEIINSLMIIYKNLDYYELEVIVVDTNYRKQGIASNMLKYFFNNYPLGDKSILLEVAVDNEAAIKLYKKFNFEIINIRKKYYRDTDAYVMKKVI